VWDHTLCRLLVLNFGKVKEISNVRVPMFGLYVTLTLLIVHVKETEN
jgi:hypothetical protein